MPGFDDDGKVRTFSTGATRDTAEGKPVPWRYGSAIVAKLYGEYMKRHQVQSDGEVRAGDNWKKGFGETPEQCIDILNDSLSRHTQDYWLHHDGYPDQATEQDVMEVLCAVKFNVDALLLEHWKKFQEERMPFPEPPTLTYSEESVILGPGEVREVHGRTLKNDSDEVRLYKIPVLPESLREFAAELGDY